MFDNKLQQITNHLGLGEDKTKQLMGALVSLVFNSKDGAAGFIQAFRNKGLGDLVISWLGSGTKLPISPSQVEGVLGLGTLASIGNRLGLPPAMVSHAAAALLPETVHRLSSNGALPSTFSSISETLKSWLGDLSNWGSLALGAGAAAVGASAHSHKVKSTKSGLGGIWPWLLLLALLLSLVVIGRSCSKSGDTATPAASSTTPAVTAPIAQPTTAPDSRLVIARNGDKVTYDGTVDSDATKNLIVDALTKSFGADKVSGNHAVDPNKASLPGWLAALGGFLPNFTANGAQLTFEGNRISLDGDIDAAAKTSLLEKVKAAFGGFTFGGLFDNVFAKAAAALSALKPGASTDDLTKALNTMVIHFATGSVSVDGLDHGLLKRAAAVIKQAPAGTKIEVGGHTDNIGDAAANQTLSEQRAAAVRDYLIQSGVASDALSSKGYGQDKPVADNATEEGRNQNRRMEFTVLK